jgi:hypothetical protein
MKIHVRITSISVLCLFALQSVDAAPTRKKIESNPSYEYLSESDIDIDRKRTKIAKEVTKLEQQFKEICDIYNNYEKKAILEKIKLNEEKISKLHSEIAMLVFIDQKENRDYKNDGRVLKFRSMIHKLSDNTIVEQVSLYSLNSPIAQRMKEMEEKLANSKMALELCGR